jgi:glutathione peroxidase
MRNVILIPAVLCLLSGFCGCQAEEEATGTLNVAPPGELYSFNVRDIDGKEVSLSAYKGKVLLIVNVASECRFTPQYRDLEKLYRKYKDRGLVVLGFPENNFGGQEPATNAQIKEFVRSEFDITFPMFAKISVRGSDIDPLYAYLTDKERNAPYGRQIEWNFAKFLIDREGRTVALFKSEVKPFAPKLVSRLEAALNK